MTTLLFIRILTQLPIWFTLFCLLAGFGYAYLLYKFKSEAKEFSKRITLLLFAARFTVVTILCFLLLSPLVKITSKESEKPVIIIAQDRSSSLKHHAASLSTYDADMQQLIADLDDVFEVRTYAFADAVTENPEKFNTFNGTATDLSNLMSELNIRYQHRNVGALILATDGIYNKGEQPVYAAGDFTFPIIPIALGDTTIYRDVLIKQTMVNPVTLLNNFFPVDVVVQAQKCRATQLSVQLMKNDSLIATQQLSVNNDNFSKALSFSVKASEIGLQHYTVNVSFAAGEKNIKNNKADIYIRVIENKHKVLVVSNSPHPDISAIRQALLGSRMIDVEVLPLNEIKSLIGYQVIVLHQLPSGTKNISSLLKTAAEQKIPLLIVVGGQSYITAVNEIKGGVQIGNYRGQSNDVLPLVNESFSLFTLSNETKNKLLQFPPLSAPFAQYQLQPQCDVLFRQEIKGIPTEQPLISFYNKEGQKFGFILGENIWKWRMTDYLQHESHLAFDEIIQKTVQYLIAKDDRSPFRILHEPAYLISQPIELFSELYNKSGEMIEDADILMQITHPGNKTFEHLFTYGNSRYQLNLGVLPAGTYTYKATCNYKNEKSSKSGSFTVMAQDFESVRTIADHQLLQRLASLNNGQLFYPTQLSQVAAYIKSNENIKPIIHVKKQLTELINIPWLFVFLLLLLSLEWFLRKRLGSY